MSESGRPRFRDLSLDEFVGRLGSADPVPGGGSASAVAAALGASLVEMVAALSEDRPRYADHAALHATVRAEARRLAARFLALAEDDAAAYARFAGALKLPRETDADRAARQAELETAARAAAEIPLTCVEACVELVRLAEALAGRSNRNASSDLNVATLLAEAAARGAGANVLVNLPSIGDEVWSARTSARVDELLHEIGRLAAVVRETVLGGEARPPLDAAGVAASS